MKVFKVYFFISLFLTSNALSIPLTTIDHFRTNVRDILLIEPEIPEQIISDFSQLLTSSLPEVRIVLDNTIKGLIEEKRDILSKTMPHPRSVLYSDQSCYQIIQRKTKILSWFLTGSSGRRRLSYLALIDSLDPDLLLSITQPKCWAEFEIISANAYQLCLAISKYEKQRRTTRARRLTHK